MKLAITYEHRQKFLLISILNFIARKRKFCHLKIYQNFIIILKEFFAKIKQFIRYVSYYLYQRHIKTFIKEKY